MAQRVVLIAVDDSDDDQRAMEWAMHNMIRSDDSVHIAHVVPRLTHALQYGAPPIDMAAPVDEQVSIVSELTIAQTTRRG